MSDTIRVMIVDDERLFAELLRVGMRSADDIDVVAVAHDVKSAIAALGEARPDVVLADYHLPDGTGADLARAVRSALPKTAIVVLTGDPSAFTLADVARSGAVGHLTKERGFNDVVGAVRAAAAGEVLFSSSAAIALRTSCATATTSMSSALRIPTRSSSAKSRSSSTIITRIVSLIVRLPDYRRSAPGRPMLRRLRGRARRDRRHPAGSARPPAP